MSSRPEDSGAQEAVRIQKFLSRAGVASRREAEGLMVQGRVRVNGKVVTELGSRVVPGRDTVEVDGRPVEEAPYRWILFHKPGGTLTTTDDPRGRTTVYDVLPEEHRGLAYVGRLDMDTEGLLLLSNEGDAIHGLLHPSSEVEREYRVGVEGVPGREALRRLRDGVELEDGPARAVEARVRGREAAGAVLDLVLVEGRKREVRRLCEAVGHPTRWLRRVRFGPVRLGDLPRGHWRRLRPEEVRAVRDRVAAGGAGRGAPERGEGGAGRGNRGGR